MDDDLVEGLAERLYEIEWPRYNPKGSDDSNYWSWHGKGNVTDGSDTVRDTYRTLARSAVEYIQQRTGEDAS